MRALLPLALALLLSSCAKPRDEMHVFAAASLAAALSEVAAGLEAERGVDVKVHAAGSQLLATQILEGAPASLFASADDVQMERVRAAGLVEPPSALARSRLVLVVAKGSEGRVRSLADLGREGVRVVLAAKTVPAGRYARALLEARGLLEPALARTVSFEDNVTSVLTKVALGEADAGVVYETDARAAGDDVVRVPLGDEGQPEVRYLVALTSRGAEQPGARAFLERLRSPEGQGVLERHGFAPVKP